MNQTAHPYKYNHNQFLFDSTQIERTNLQNSGMVELSPNEMIIRLSLLKFKISNSDSFIYTNNMNSTTYKAKSCYIVDIKTKLSFAHVDFSQANRERVDELQKFRRTHYAYCHKTHCIWDI